jgi:O-antigen/teichoic acid export membrane protein
MFKHLRQLATESLVYGLSGVVSRFLAIFLIPVYTRIFSPEDYGVISLITATMAVISTFVVLALDTASARWYWDTDETGDRQRTMASWAWCQMALSVLFGLILFAAAEPLGRIIVERADAGLYFRLTAISLPMSALGVVTTNWLRFQRRPWATTGFNLGTSLFNILLTIALVVWLRWGITGVYVSQLATAVLSTLLAVALMRGWLHPRHFDWSRLRDMLRFALPLIPGALAFWIVNSSDRLFVQAFSTTSEVGLYQVGSYVASLVALVSLAFQQAWGAFAMSIHKQPEAKQVYAATFLAYWWLMCGLSTGLALLAPEALRILTTEQYAGASPVVGFLAFSYVMIGLVQIAAIGPTIARTTRPTGLAVMAAAGLNIVLNIALVPALGKTGSAIATLISQSIVPVYVFWRGQQLYPIPYRFGAALGIFALAWLLIVLGGSLPAGNPALAFLVKLALLALFVPALFALRIVTPAQARRAFHSIRHFHKAPQPDESSAHTI